jgi:tryptophan-rich sensory protein
LGVVAAGAVVFGVQKLTPTFDASWYKAIKKPEWTPPNWAFPAVWIPLKALQSVGLWLAYRQITAGMGGDTSAKARALALPVGVFGTMLALGNYWNVVFFGQRRMKASIKVMGAFWASVLGSVAAFWAAGSPLAGLCVAPTSIWVTIAAKLNWDIVQLNPELHEKEQ